MGSYPLTRLKRFLDRCLIIPGNVGCRRAVRDLGHCEYISSLSRSFIYCNIEMHACIDNAGQLYIDICISTQGTGRIFLTMLHIISQIVVYHNRHMQAT